MMVQFVETPIFTRLAHAILRDDEYRAFQFALVLRPDLGSVIQGSGGLRKVRWAAGGHGKRGGLRIIYFWEATRRVVYCLYIYRKNEQGDLTAGQVRTLRRIVEEEFK